MFVDICVLGNRWVLYEQSLHVTFPCSLIGHFRYTWCLAFAATLQQLNDLAVQREDLAENLNTQIVFELMRYIQELKVERKTVSKQTNTTVKKN